MTAEESKQIDAAVQAHGAWLGRLRTAVEEGTSDFRPEVVKADDQCDFGRWLHGSIGFKRLPAFEEIRGLHAEFHRKAAQILALATCGRSVEAHQLLEPKGEFMLLSGKLVIRLKSLKG